MMILWHFLVGFSVAAFSSQVSAEESHLFFGCEIYDIRNPANPQLLRKFPGEICLFQNDGSVVMSLPDRVAKFDGRMKEQWSLSTRAHHQINLSPDGKRILVIGSEIVTPNKQAGSARSDVLFVLNQSGKLLKRFSFFSQRKQLDARAWNDAVLRKFPMIWNIARFADAKWELTHANTFYEIDSHSAEKARPEFAKGNYIVNDISLMMAIVLDADLKKVVWQKSLRPETENMTHDVQVLPSGRLFYYDNGTAKTRQSQLIEWDIATGKDVWIFKGREGQKFYAPRWGGVQRLSNGGTLYTDITVRPEIIELDSLGKVVWSWFPGDGKYLQQARKADLREFLKNNRAL